MVTKRLSHFLRILSGHPMSFTAECSLFVTNTWFSVLDTHSRLHIISIESFSRGPGSVSRLLGRPSISIPALISLAPPVAVW